MRIARVLHSYPSLVCMYYDLESDFWFLFSFLMYSSYIFDVIYSDIEGMFWWIEWVADICEIGYDLIKFTNDLFLIQSKNETELKDHSIECTQDLSEPTKIRYEIEEDLMGIVKSIVCITAKTLQKSIKSSWNRRWTCWSPWVVWNESDCWCNRKWIECIPKQQNNNVQKASGYEYCLKCIRV